MMLLLHVSARGADSPRGEGGDHAAHHRRSRMQAGFSLCNNATGLQRSSRTQAAPVASADPHRCNGTATGLRS